MEIDRNQLTIPTIQKKLTPTTHAEKTLRGKYTAEVWIFQFVFTTFPEKVRKMPKPFLRYPQVNRGSVRTGIVLPDHAQSRQADSRIFLLI
jgi:hypothetical protein